MSPCLKQAHFIKTITTRFPLSPFIIILLFIHARLTQEAWELKSLMAPSLKVGLHPIAAATWTSSCSVSTLVTPWARPSHPSANLNPLAAASGVEMWWWVMTLEEKVIIMIIAVSVKSSFKRQPLTCYVTSFRVPSKILRKIYLKSLKPMDAVGCLWPHHVISDNKILQAQEIKRASFWGGLPIAPLNSIAWCLGTGMGQMLVCCAVPQGQSCHDEIQCMYHTVPESAVAWSASLHLIHFLFKLVTQFEMVEVPWFSI